MNILTGKFFVQKCYTLKNINAFVQLQSMKLEYYVNIGIMLVVNCVEFWRIPVKVHLKGKPPLIF